MHMPEACLSAEERVRLLDSLRQSEAGFLQLLSGLTEAQWRCRIAAEGWSIQQIAEHLVLGERAMYTMASAAMHHPPHPDWQEHQAPKATLLHRVLPEPSVKVTAPDPLLPHHDWTIEHTISRFQAGRAKTIAFTETPDLPLHAHLSEHPFPIFNLLSAYHWLLYIALHNTRHNSQIAGLLQDAPVEVAP